MASDYRDPDSTHTRLAAVSAERRVQLRTPVQLQASLSTEDLEMDCDVEVLAAVENASEGGLFVRSQFLEPRGTHVRLRVVTPARAITVRGRVAWVDENRALGPGMGIELDDASREIWLASAPITA